MDDVKKKQHKFLGYGGMKCRCCNPFRDAHRGKLNKAARAALKESDIDLIKRGVYDYDTRYDEFGNEFEEDYY